MDASAIAGELDRAQDAVLNRVNGMKQMIDSTVAAVRRIAATGLAGRVEVQLRDFRDPYDLELGARRARAALLLTMGLPGVAYVYQGEEMGVPEVEDLPPEVLQDPVWQRSGFTDTGRDG